jgi:hypothetical protein
MERGFDPELKKYFRKILYSFFYGLLWLAANVTGGIYFKLAYRSEQPVLVNILFYTFLVASLSLLLRYYYRIWKN